MPSILWAGPAHTLVRSTLGTTRDGYRLAGTALTGRDGAPVEMRYVIMTDPSWRPRHLGVHVLGTQPDARLALAGDGEGSWTLDGDAVPALSGCTHVDLGFTPASLTLLVNRLALAPGESGDVRAASIGFPGDPVAAIDLTLNRIGDLDYRLAGPGFDRELRVNTDHFAVSYAGWEAVASG